MERLFIQLMYNSQLEKNDPYDWFCGHIYAWLNLL